MRDVLVVYYSRSGTTDVVARALATALGADLDRITPAVSYAGAAGFVRGLWHALRRIGPPIRKRFDPAPFKTVVLCSPVWAGRLPGPVRTYLQEAGRRRTCSASPSRARGARRPPSSGIWSRSAAAPACPPSR